MHLYLAEAALRTGRLDEAEAEARVGTTTSRQIGDTWIGPASRSLWAAVLQLRTLWGAGNWLLLVLDVIIICCAIWVIVEAFTAITKSRKEPAVTWRDDETIPGELADARTS